jgi:hypothetical protein
MCLRYRHKDAIKRPSKGPYVWGVPRSCRSSCLSLLAYRSVDVWSQILPRYSGYFLDHRATLCRNTLPLADRLNG